MIVEKTQEGSWKWILSIIFGLCVLAGCWLGQLELLSAGKVEPEPWNEEYECWHGGSMPSGHQDWHSDRDNYRYCSDGHKNVPDSCCGGVTKPRRWRWIFPSSVHHHTIFPSYRQTGSRKKRHFLIRNVGTSFKSTKPPGSWPWTHHGLIQRSLPVLWIQCNRLHMDYIMVA